MEMPDDNSELQPDERDRIMASFSPEMQENFLHFHKVQTDSCKLLTILFTDLRFAATQLNAIPGEHPDAQFWRRTAIRTLATTVEGEVFCFKRFALAASRLNGCPLVTEEQFFLSEEFTEEAKEKKFRLSCFRENIKRTFKLVAKVLNSPCSVDFGRKGFESLCEIYELRSALMHPKSYESFAVTDDQTEKADEAIAWVQDATRTLFDLCKAYHKFPEPGLN
jgi:hypothetical protein